MSSPCLRANSVRHGPSLNQGTGNRDKMDVSDHSDGKTHLFPAFCAMHSWSPDVLMRPVSLSTSMVNEYLQTHTHAVFLQLPISPLAQFGRYTKLAHHTYLIMGENSPFGASFGPCQAND